MSDRKLEPLSIWAVVGSVFFFPVGFLLSIVAIAKIVRSRGKKSGLIFALTAFFLSGAWGLWIAYGAYAFLFSDDHDARFCETAGSEAVQGLRAIQRAEKQFHEENGRYASFEELPPIEVHAPAFEFAVDATANDFVASAAGKFERLKGDLWSIRNSGKPEHTQNLCELLRNKVREEQKAKVRETE